MVRISEHEQVIFRPSARVVLSQLVFISGPFIVVGVKRIFDFLHSFIEDHRLRVRGRARLHLRHLRGRAGPLFRIRKNLQDPFLDYL